MTPAPTDPRALARRVAALLRDKGKSAEAVLVLSAWAASGPNDAEGQALLAEALRLEPQSAIAKKADERMEGITASDHAELEKAIKSYPAEELGRLDREGRPAFQRAQVGFNNNLKHKGKHYHVQTEDSGLNKPHVSTHVFADGGRFIKSHKRSYAAAVDRPDVVTFVRALMKGQHMEMVQWLREGRFDPIIDGQRTGGMEVLEHPPVVDVGQVGSRAPEPARPAGSPPPPRPPTPRPSRPRPAPSPPAAPAPEGKVRFTLHVLRSLSDGPERYDPRGGHQGDRRPRSRRCLLAGERFCHPREAMISWESDRLWLDDLEGGNGVFLRIRSPVAMRAGGEFVVGDQLLRLERNPEADDGPAEGPTYFLSSIKRPSAFRVVQLFEGGAAGACAMARETLLQVGSAQEYANDLILARDPLVAPYPCVIEEQAEVLASSLRPGREERRLRPRRRPPGAGAGRRAHRGPDPPAGRGGRHLTLGETPKPPLEAGS